MKRLIARLMLCLLSVVAYGNGDELFKQGAVLFESDPAQAFPLFVQAAEEGNVSAMVGAAHCFENGIGTDLDYALAIMWYENAVAQNNLKACEGLAHIYASCPDPRFHDGEKAVKYAGALARKDPRDPDVLALLAAAYARNADFGQAVKVAEKAVKYETRKKSQKERQRMLEEYRQGRPFPSMVTGDWLIDAAKKGSTWALERAVCAFADRFDPMHDPVVAMELCQQGIEAGRDEMYVLLGNLYLNEHSNLGKALECYQRAHEYFIKQTSEYVNSKDRKHLKKPKSMGYWMEIAFMDWMEKSGPEVYAEAKRIMEGWDVYFVRTREKISVLINEDNPSAGCRTEYLEDYYSSASMDDMKKRYPFFSGQTYHGNGITIEVRRNPPIMAEALFLLKIAAAKGVSEAGETIASIEQDISRYHAVLENQDGLDRNAWADALSAAALKFCDNAEVPVNPALAEQMYLQAYYLKPSPRRACTLGFFYFYDDLEALHHVGGSEELYVVQHGEIRTRQPIPTGPFPRHFERDLEAACTWLRLAADSGYDFAIRRLAEIYACGEPNDCDGELAVKYATRYAESRPKDLYAQKLLACAYARNDDFKRATEIMENIIAQEEAKDGKCSRQSTRMRNTFKRGSCWAMSHWEDDPWPRELPTPLVEKIKALEGQED